MLEHKRGKTETTNDNAREEHEQTCSACIEGHALVDETHGVIALTFRIRLKPTQLLGTSRTHRNILLGGITHMRK